MLLTREPRFIRIYKAIKPHLSEFEISRIRLFGSFAKGTSTPKSDIDIILDIHKPIGIYRFIGLKQELETKLDRKIDLFEPDNLDPNLKEQIITEAITIYEQR